jgi:hypothetical protein
MFGDLRIYSNPRGYDIDANPIYLVPDFDEYGVIEVW